MSILLHLADRVLNRPLLISPDKAQTIAAVLGGRIGLAGVPDASRFVGEDLERDENGRPVKGLPYRITRAGVAVITVTGSLVNRGAWVGASSGLTSYEGIKFQLGEAAANPRVRSVILDLQSPGGEAVGAFETAAAVRAVSAVKPVVAVVNGMAASAAYAIASGATEIVTTETGVSGSIGVVLLHADFSQQLAEDGIKPTLIFAGAHKVDGNPFEPLPDGVRADLQGEVDAFYSAFLETVALGRGKRLTVDAARKTEARTFIGKAAVAVGLADRLGTFESVLAELSRQSGATGLTSQQAKGTKMENENGSVAAGGDAVANADHDAAVTKAHADGKAAGAAEATARLSGILGAETVAGDAARMAAALDLAVKAPGMSVDDVVGFVSKNVSTATAPGEGFRARMNGTTNADTGTGAGGQSGADGEPGGRLLSLAARRKDALNAKR